MWLKNLISFVKWRSTATPQYLVALIVSFAGISLGSILGWSSPALPSLEKSGDFPDIDSTDLSWIGSLPTIGAVAGAPIAGYCVEKIGRRYTLLLSILPTTLGWICICFGRHVAMLYVGRSFTGIGLGFLIFVPPVYLSEISQSRVRGFVGLIFQVSVRVGLLFTYVVGSYISYNHLAGISATFPVIFAFSTILLPESPRYLLSTGQTEEATNAMCWLRASGTRFPTEEVYDSLNEITESINESKRTIISFKDLLTPKIIKPFMIIMCLMFFNQFCRGNAFMFYIVTIFDQTGSSVLDSYMSGMLVGIFQLVVTIFVWLLIEKAGRKVLIILSFLLMCVSLICLGTYFELQRAEVDMPYIVNWVTLVSLIVYNSAYIGGVASLVWTVMSEILPSEIIGYCSGLITMFNYSLAFITTRFFQDFIQLIGIHNAFWVFSAFCGSAGIFCYFFVPETKGKSLGDIQKKEFSKSSETSESISGDTLSTQSSYDSRL